MSIFSNIPGSNADPIERNARDGDVDQGVLLDADLGLGAGRDLLKEVDEDLECDLGSGGNDQRVREDSEGLNGQGLLGALTEPICEGP